jgi:hypothetical protein
LLESKINDYLEGFKKKRPAKPDTCEVCKRCDCLRWHGSYVRDLIALAKTYSIPIRRLFCTLCRHTFALLPSFIVKFHRYAKDVIQTALAWLKSHTFESTVEHLVNRLMTGREHNLAAVTLYLWRRKFHTTLCR